MRNLAAGVLFGFVAAFLTGFAETWGQLFLITAFAFLILFARGKGAAENRNRVVGS
jgi:hypothetical protein